jgi:hypothetical protein
MLSLGARVVPSSDKLLSIVACERKLVVSLLEGACGGGVPIFNIKSTGKTNIPIVVSFVNVGEVRVPDPWQSQRDSLRDRDGTPTVWDTWAWCANTRHSPLRSHVVSKGGTAPATMTASAAPTLSSPPPSRAESTQSKLLLDRHCKLLDRGYKGNWLTSTNGGGGRCK